VDGISSREERSIVWGILVLHTTTTTKSTAKKPAVPLFALGRFPEKSFHQKAKPATHTQEGSRARTRALCPSIIPVSFPQSQKSPEPTVAEPCKVQEASRMSESMKEEKTMPIFAPSTPLDETPSLDAKCKNSEVRPKGSCKTSHRTDTGAARSPLIVKKCEKESKRPELEFCVLKKNIAGEHA
jgi:hypothetical protein